MIAADGSFADALLPVLFSQAAAACLALLLVVMPTCCRVFFFFTQRRRCLVSAGYGRGRIYLLLFSDLSHGVFFGFLRFVLAWLFHWFQLIPASFLYCLHLAALFPYVVCVRKLWALSC